MLGLASNVAQVVSSGMLEELVAALLLLPCAESTTAREASVAVVAKAVSKGCHFVAVFVKCRRRRMSE